MLSPHVTAIPHAGASPYAPAMTPSEIHADRRCQPLTAPVLPPVTPVDPLAEETA